MTSAKVRPAGRLLQSLTRRPNASVRLFCFPYAGGGTSVYRRWSELPESIDVWGVQPPGREDRILEPPCDRMAELVELICGQMPDQLDRPYAFFGHSMGATVGWEVARELIGRGYPEPTRLFVSGCRAPHRRDDTSSYLLPDHELIDELRKMDGTPEAILDNEELMRFLLPTIRADFAVLERYKFRSGAPITIPITAMGGTEDVGVRPEHLAAWGELTGADCDVHMFAGGHLFLRERQDSLLDLIGARIATATIPWRP